MTVKCSEKVLVENFVSFMAKRGCKVYTEVPCLGQSFDGVFYFNDEIISFEAKLSSWRRAIQQCKAHKLCSDRIFVLLSSEKISNTCLLECRMSGIGIVSLSEAESVKIILWPPKNRNIWIPEQKQLKNRLRNL